MKKIVLSLAVIAVVSIAVVGATRAFFSDTETSTGNTFTAGAIDLQVMSQCSYSFYSGTGEKECGEWGYPESGQGITLGKFFNFGDVKPGDWGENTVSFKVLSNDAWMCADVTSTNSENSITEPEAQLADDDTKGELGDTLSVFWWVDDGNNIYEQGEKVLYDGPRTLNEWLALGGGSLPLTIADSNLNWKNWPENTTIVPVPGGEEQHLGIAWCVGTITLTGTAPAGFSCNGASATNISQTDSVTADLTFTAEQFRNNAGFDCAEHRQPTREI